MPTSRRAAVVGLAVACLLGGASAAMYQGRDLGSTEVDEAMLNVDRTVSGLKCEVPGAIVSASASGPDASRCPLRAPSACPVRGPARALRQAALEMG